VAPIVRIAAGVAFGAAGVVFFAAVAALRDAGLMWLAVDVGLLVLATAVVSAGIVALRRQRRRAPVIRAWSAVGAAVLLALALLVFLD
jgi:hypothetical protein